MSEDIDALIATKVMGWFGHTESGLEGRLIWIDMNCAAQDKNPYYRGRVTGYDSWNWKSSTNIAHAWEVAERLKDDDCGFSLQYAPSLGWLCWFRRGLEYVSRADHAPMAICLAALRAVGHDLTTVTP